MAENNLNIQISTKLTIDNIKQQVAAVEKQIRDKIKLGVELDTGNITERLKQSKKKIQEQINQTPLQLKINAATGINNISKITNEQKNVYKQMFKEITNEHEKMQSAISNSASRNIKRREQEFKYQSQAINRNAELQRKSDEQMASALASNERRRREEIEKTARIQSQAINRNLEAQHRANQRLEQMERQRIARLNSNNTLSSSVRFYDQLTQQEIQTSMQSRLSNTQGVFNTVQNNRLINRIATPQQIAAMNAQFITLSNTIGNITNNRMAQQWNTQFNQLRSTVQGFNQQLRTTHSVMGNLGTAVSKLFAWTVGATLFFAPIRGIQAMVKSLKDMEDALVSIQRVMEDSNFKMAEFGNSMLNIAKNTGSTFKQTADVALRFAQAGYDMNETLGLTKTALMAVQTAELDATKATESMIGIMSQWNMQASEMPLLLDKINKISDEYTVTSEDLVQGLLRSSSAAKSLGISLDETIALLTVMRETSGRTGKEVGNALNSILSYATRGKTIDVLEGAGINVFADEQKTQFRNFMDVFEDISKNWNNISTEMQDGFVKSAEEAQLFNEELANTIGLEQEWSDVQKRNVSNATAGTYRRNYFLALIENFGKTKKVMEDLNSAQGYTLGEMDKNLDKISTKWNQFLDTIQQKVFSIGEAGATGGIKKLLDVLIVGAENLGTVLIILTGILVGLNAKLVGTLMTSVAASTRNLIGLTGAIRGVSTSLTGLQVAAGWIGIIGVALGAGIAVFNHFNETTEETKQKIESLNTEIEKIDAKKTNVQNLAKEFEELNKNVNNLSTEELEKFNKVQNDLVKLMPGIVASYDAEGNARIKNIESIKEEIKNLEDLKNIKEKGNRDSFLKLIGGEQESFSQKSNLLSNLNSTKSKFGSEYADEEAYKSGYKNYNDAVMKLNEDIRTSAKNIDDYKNKISATIPEFQKLGGITKKVGDELADNIFKNQFSGKLDTKNIEEFEKSLKALSANLDSSKVQSNWEAYDKLVESFKNGTATSEQLNKAHYDLRVQLVNLGLSYEQVNKLLQDPSGIEKYTNSTIKAKSSIEELAKLQEDLDKSFKKSVDNAQILTDAISELDQEHKLSSKTLEGLIQDYPQLANYLNDEAKLREELNNTLDTEISKQKQAFTVKLENSDKYYNQVILGNSQLVESINNTYKIDLHNFRTVAEAKEGINKALIKSLAIDWSKLFGTQAQAMNDMYLIANNMQGPQQTNVKALLNPGDIEKYKAAQTVSDNMKKAMDEIVNKVNFRELDTKDGKSSTNSKSTPAEKDIPEKVIQKDKYALLNIEIQKYLNLIEESKALLEDSSLSDIEKNKQLSKQIENYKLLQDAAHRKAEATRQEREELIKSMSSQGFNFQGVGDNTSISNAESALQSKLDIVNEHRADKDKTLYNEIKAEYEDMVQAFNRFNDIQTKDIPELQRTWLGYKKDIASTKETISKNTTDNLLKSQEAQTTSLSQSLDKLKSAYEDLSDNQFNLKLSNINDQLDNQIKSVEEYKKQISDLGLAFNSVDSQEQKDRLHEQADKLRKEIENVQKDISKNSKLKVDIEVDLLFDRSSKSAEHYSDMLEYLDYRENLLGENDFNNQLDIKQQKIDTVTKEIQLQTEELEKLNSVTDEAIVNDKDFVNKKNDLVKSLQNNILKIKELNKAQADIIVNSVEETESKIQEIIKKGLELKKDKLDEELEQYRDFIDDRMQLLDDANETEDYNQDLKEALSEREEIQKKINEISYDTSFSGFQQRKELQKDYDEATKKIEDLQKNRHRDLEKDALADSLKFKEDSVDEEKKLLDQTFDENKMRIMAHEALMNQSFDEIRKQFPELFSELGNASDTFFTTFKSYQTEFGQGIEGMASTIETKLIPQLQLATKYAGQYDSIKKKSEGIDSDISNISPSTQSAINTANSQANTQFNNSQNNNSNSTSTALTSAEIDAMSIRRYQERWNEIQNKISSGQLKGEELKQAEKDKTELGNLAESIRKKHGWEFKNLVGMSDNEIRGIYHTGVLQGAIPSTGNYLLKKGELVLNEQNMANLIRNMSLMSMPNIKPNIPQLSGGINGGINLAINIAGNADENTIGKIKQVGNNILSDIKKTLSKNGIYKN